MKITNVQEIRAAKHTLQEVIKNMVLSFDDDYDVNVVDIESHWINGRGCRNKRLVSIDIKIEI
jgi:hypothetical protein